jgi:hypothetical protein
MLNSMPKTTEICKYLETAQSTQNYFTTGTTLQLPWFDSSEQQFHPYMSQQITGYVVAPMTGDSDSTHL